MRRAALFCSEPDSDSAAYKNKIMSQAAYDNELIVTVSFDSVEALIEDGGSSYDVVLAAEDVENVPEGIELIRV